MMTRMQGNALDIYSTVLMLFMHRVEVLAAKNHKIKGHTEAAARGLGLSRSKLSVLTVSVFRFKTDRFAVYRFYRLPFCRLPF